MNTQRARRIANSFGNIGSVQVEELSGGLLVRYQGHSCYFVRETCFWPFVNKIAGTSLREVAKIELQLVA